LFYHLNETNNSFPESLQNKMYVIDTLELAKGSIERNEFPFPTNYKLVTLYNYCTNKDYSDEAHRALADVNATTEIFLHLPFWLERMNNVWKINKEGIGEQLITGLKNTNRRLSIPTLIPIQTRNRKMLI
jgi:DNA polymerase III alpha subunit (gram-positive type)